MGEKTHITWTESTWNPWQGCHKVSQGCKNCYMFRQKRQFGQEPDVVLRSSDVTFKAPLRWQGPRMIFTCSWSDFFIEEADPWRDEAWDIIRATPRHIYQILTKRPERIAESLPADWGDGWRHVWLGVSVESQEYTHRLDTLAGIPAAIRFVSAEPLLGPLDLRPWLGVLDWVIVGGESGPDFRPMDMAWARDIRDQATLYGVAFFFKQDAERRAGQRPYIVEENGLTTVWQEMP